MGDSAVVRVKCPHCWWFADGRELATHIATDHTVYNRPVPAQEPLRITDAEALDRIAKLMSGVEWDSGLPCEVADVVRATGREIEEPEADDDEGVPPDPRARHRCNGCGLQWFTDGLRPLTGGEPDEATGRCQYCNGVTVAFVVGRMVECGLCHKQTPMGTAHAHGGQWIGHDCCWGKQLAPLRDA